MADESLSDRQLTDLSNASKEHLISLINKQTLKIKVAIEDAARAQDEAQKSKEEAQKAVLLKEQCAKLKDAVTKLIEQRNTWKARVDELETAVALARTRQEGLESQVMKLSGYIAKTASLEQDLEASARLLQKRDEDLAKYKENNRDLEDTVKDLRTFLDKHETVSNRKVESKDKEISGLNLKISSLETALKESKLLLLKSTDTEMELKNAIQETENRGISAVHIAKVELAAVNAESANKDIAELSLKLSEKTATIEKLTNTNELNLTEISQLKCYLNKIEEEIKIVSERNRDYDLKLNTAEKKLESIVEENLILRAHTSNATKSSFTTVEVASSPASENSFKSIPPSLLNVEYDTKLSELEESKMTIDKLREENFAETEIKKVLVADLANLKLKILELQKQIGSAAANSSKSEDNDISHNSSINNIRDPSDIQLLSETEALSSIHKDAAASISNSELESKLNVSQGEGAKLQKKLDASNEEMRAFKLEVKKIVGELNSKYGDEKARLESELASTQAALRNAKEETIRERSDSDAYIRTMEKLREENDIISQRMSTLKEEKETAAKKASNLKTQLSNAENKIDELTVSNNGNRHSSGQIKQTLLIAKPLLQLLSTSLLSAQDTIKAQLRFKDILAGAMNMDDIPDDEIANIDADGSSAGAASPMGSPVGHAKNNSSSRQIFSERSNGISNEGDDAITAMAATLSGESSSNSKQGSANSIVEIIVSIAEALKMLTPRVGRIQKDAKLVLKVGKSLAEQIIKQKSQTGANTKNAETAQAMTSKVAELEKAALISKQVLLRANTAVEDTKRRIATLTRQLGLRTKQVYSLRKLSKEGWPSMTVGSGEVHSGEHGSNINGDDGNENYGDGINYQIDEPLSVDRCHVMSRISISGVSWVLLAFIPIHYEGGASNKGSDEATGLNDRRLGLSDRGNKNPDSEETIITSAINVLFEEHQLNLTHLPITSNSLSTPIKNNQQDSKGSQSQSPSLSVSEPEDDARNTFVEEDGDFRSREGLLEPILQFNPPLPPNTILFWTRLDAWMEKVYDEYSNASSAMTPSAAPLATENKVKESYGNSYEVDIAEPQTSRFLISVTMPLDKYISKIISTTSSLKLFETIHIPPTLLPVIATAVLQRTNSHWMAKHAHAVAMSAELLQRVTKAEDETNRSRSEFNEYKDRVHSLFDERKEQLKAVQREAGHSAYLQQQISGLRAELQQTFASSNKITTEQIAHENQYKEVIDSERAKTSELRNLIEVAESRVREALNEKSKMEITVKAELDQLKYDKSTLLKQLQDTIKERDNALHSLSARANNVHSSSHRRNSLSSVDTNSLILSSVPSVGSEGRSTSINHPSVSVKSNNSVTEGQQTNMSSPDQGIFGRVRVATNSSLFASNETSKSGILGHDWNLSVDIPTEGPLALPPRLVTQMQDTSNSSIKGDSKHQGTAEDGETDESIAALLVMARSGPNVSSHAASSSPDLESGSIRKLSTDGNSGSDNLSVVKAEEIRIKDQEAVRTRERIRDLQRTVGELEIALSSQKEREFEIEGRLQEAERSLKRSTQVQSNIEYLKNVIVRYMENPDDHDRLFPVLDTVLQLSPEEIENIGKRRAARAQQSKLFGGWL